MSGPRAYDPDLGPIAVVDFPDKDRKKWAKAKNLGQWFAYPEDGAPQYHEVFLCALGTKLRFIGIDGKQYGPEHRAMYPAFCWAFGHGWIDPGQTAEQNIACQVEMRCNSTARPKLRSLELEPGSWEEQMAVSSSGEEPPDNPMDGFRAPHGPNHHQHRPDPQFAAAGPGLTDHRERTLQWVSRS